MLTEILITKAAAGDPAAFAHIVTKYSGLVFSLCFSRTGDRDAAEDLTQDVFVTVYEKLASLKDPGKFAGWLRRITVNRCNLWSRERRPQVSLDQVQEQVPTHRDAPSLRARREAQILVNDALQTVSEKNRIVLLLHYASGYSYQEIADLLEMPVVTVKSRLREGRQQMKRELLKVIRELLQMHLSSSELADQVVARCGSKTCSCAQELMNP